MTEYNHVRSSKEGVNQSVFVMFCFCIAAALVLAYLFGMMPVRKGELVDSDCYMRLTRVTDLYKTGDWYHPSPMKTNTPYGDVSHWTRPLDGLLLLGAVPLSKLMGFKDALFTWGVLITPVLLAITLIALNWATKVILTRDGTFLVILLFLSQTVLLSYFQPARPDHHGLLILLFVLLVGLGFRLVLKPFKPSICYAAAAVGAVSVWVSVESQVLTCFSFGILGLFWIFQEEEFLKKNLHFSISLCVFSFICLLLERPVSDILIVEYDRLSILYVCLLGLMALFWIMAAVVDMRSPYMRSRTSRFAYCILGGAAVALVMWLLYPSFYKGPMADVDPRIIPIWLSRINEIQPLLSGSISLSMSLQVVGTAIISFGFLGYLFLRKGDAVSRNGWIYISVSAAFFVLMSLLQVRWAVYAQILLSIVMAELLCRILQWRQDQGNKLVRALRNGLVILFFAWGFCYAGIVIEKITKENGPNKAHGKVSLVRMCEYLDKDPKWAHQNLRILTHLNFAGEILYRTPHEVLGSNYHRNGSGIMDTYNIMMAQTDAEAFELIRRRKLEIILICPDSIEDIFHPKSKDSSTFYQRLQEIPPSDGLRRVALPEDLAKDFLLFEVIY